MASPVDNHPKPSGSQASIPYKKMAKQWCFSLIGFIFLALVGLGFGSDIGKFLAVIAITLAVLAFIKFIEARGKEKSSGALLLGVGALAHWNFTSTEWMTILERKGTGSGSRLNRAPPALFLGFDSLLMGRELIPFSRPDSVEIEEDGDFHIHIAYWSSGRNPVRHHLCIPVPYDRLEEARALLPRLRAGK